MNEETKILRAQMEQDTEELVARFFDALERLKADKVIHGIQTFTRRYGINRWNLLRLRDEKTSGVMRPVWLVYLVRDYKVNPHWLLLGEGDFYIPGVTADIVRYTLSMEAEKSKIASKTAEKLQEK